jgi:hypothetical protein
MLFYDWTDFLKIKKIIDITREEISKGKTDMLNREISRVYKDKKKEIEMKKMRDRYYEKWRRTH